LLYFLLFDFGDCCLYRFIGNCLYRETGCRRARKEIALCNLMENGCFFNDASDNSFYRHFICIFIERMVLILFHYLYLFHIGENYFNLSEKKEALVLYNNAHEMKSAAH